MIPRVAKIIRNFIEEGWAKETLLALPRVALLLPKLLGDKRIDLRTRLALLGLGVYLISPWDFLPDFIPGVGQLDDMVALLLLVDGVFNQIDEQILLEHWTGRPETLRRLRATAALVAALIPRKFRDFLFGKIVAIGKRHATDND